MSRQAAIVLVVASAALLAGCSLPGDAGESADPTPTITPASVPDAEDQAVTAPQVRPPGILDGEVVSSSTLATEHQAVLENETYRVRERSVWVNTGPEVRDTRAVQTATTWYRNGTVVRHERQRLEIRLYEPDAATWTNTSTYRIGDQRYVRTERNGTVSTAVVPADSLSGRTRDNTTQTVEQLLDVENSTVESVVYNGEPRYLVTGTDPGFELYRLSHDYQADAVIQTTGLVEQLEVSYSESVIGRDRHVDYRMVVDPVPPEAIERPDWVAQLQANASASGNET